LGARWARLERLAEVLRLTDHLPGRVVTAAGMVFAFTMASMIVSSLRVVGQLGTTIGLGLLVDTLIVRSFMTPSIAAALGRWFWWPLNTFRAPGNAAPKPEPEPEAATAPLTQTTTAGRSPS
jgi:RND superfamily putative drug exporter